MPLSKLTQITAERRTLLFDPQARVFKRFRSVTVPRELIITEMQEREKGINSRIMARAPKAIARVKSWFERKGYPPIEVKIRQALELENIAAEFADHAVKSTISKDALVDEAQSMKLDTKSLTHRQVESKVWEHYFGLFISHFYRRNKSTSKEVINTLVRLNRYLTIPHSMHDERGRHWHTIEKIEAKLRTTRIDPASNLGAEAQRTLYRFLGPLSQKNVHDYHNAARDLTLAASIYADLVRDKSKSELRNEDETNKFWAYAYSDGMQKIFPLLGNDEKLFNTISDLNKRELLKKK